MALDRHMDRELDIFSLFASLSPVGIKAGFEKRPPKESVCQLPKKSRKSPHLTKPLGVAQSLIGQSLCRFLVAPLNSPKMAKNCFPS